jgi:lipopolysaccharide exporter
MPQVIEQEKILGQVPSPGVRKRGRSSFAPDVMKLVGGTAVAQVLTVLVAPILSRIYPPDAFGTAAVFISIASMIGVIACLRYELAIMLPEHDGDAANLLAVSLSIVLIVTSLTAVIVLCAGDPILRMLNLPELSSYLWLLPLFVLPNGVFLALNYWNSRTRHFGRLSVAKIFQSGATNGIQLGAGVAGQAQAAGLIEGSVLGAVVATIVLGIQIWRDDRQEFMRAVHWPRMLEWAKRHRKFPFFTTWSALLNTLSWQLPTFLLAAFFSPTVVGYYALGNRMLRLPMNLVGNAISQVFFQRASESQQVDGDLASVVALLFRRLVAWGAFPMLLLAVIGQDIFIVVFGREWAEAGVYTQILSIWMFFVFISSPLSTLYSVLERQQSALLINMVLFVTRLVALAAGGLLGSARLALSLFAVSGVLVYGGLSAWIMRASGVPYWNAFEIVAKYLAVSLLIIFPVGIVKFLKPDQSFPVLLVSLAAAVVYALFLLRDEPELVALVTRKLSRRKIVE